MPVSTRPPLIDYTARDFAGALDALEDFVRTTRPEDFTDFFETNLGVTLIELAAYVTDMLSYGQDVTAQEIYLSTARRLDSVLRFARSVGAPTPSARGATVIATSDTLPASIVSYGAVIAAGSFISGANGLRYEVIEDQTVVPGTSTVSVALREGQSFSEEFDPDTSPRQEFLTSRGIVEQDQWSVFVGDVNDPTNEWTEVANVAFETADTESYETYFDGQGRLHVVFGDGIAGKIPGDTITLFYRTTNGEAGNAAVNTIRGSVLASVIGTSTTAAITLQNTTQASTGGQNRASVEELRISIPAYIRTLDKVITLLDYEEAVAANVAGVGLAFADIPQSSYSGNIVRVHAWDTQQITFVSTSPNQGTTSAVAYQQYTQIPSSRVYAIQSYLRPRTIATVHNVVIRPTVAQVDLDFAKIKYDTVNAAEDVHRGIVQAMVDLFEESSGFLVRISDLYARVLEVPGVLGFTIRRIVFEHIDFDDPNVGTVIDEYRTDQDIGGAQGGPFNPLQDIEIPGVTRRAYYDDTFLYNNEIQFTDAIDATVIQAINLRSLVFELIAG